jgi:O-acetyl-ADP-ribose deacetylase (regulator of RNase III)
MKLVQGDMVQMAATGEYDVVLQGCNCMCQMGKGVALYLKNKWKEVYEADLQTVKGDASKLGSYTSATVDVNGKPVTIVNGYTQYDYSNKEVMVNYYAIMSVLTKVKNEYSGKKILMSKIGCGLAQGDWNVVAKMVNDVLANEDVTVAEYNKPM